MIEALLFSEMTWAKAYRPIHQTPLEAIKIKHGNEFIDLFLSNKLMD